MKQVDVVVIGAGVAGLMCAIQAGKRGRKVLILDSANKPGKKILMSGGGRCNFTNYHIDPQAYLSHNPHFCKSALKRYTQWDFIDLVRSHHIPFHEKTLGQLFCDNKSQAILNMLLAECEKVNAPILLNCKTTSITKIHDYQFKIACSEGDIHCQSLVIASGGLSIPTLGASSFGYEVAKQFHLKVWPTRPGLVPFTFPGENNPFKVLSGISVNSIVSVHNIQFRENILFTHRGLSGPAILQISSYWQPGESVNINLLPDVKLLSQLRLAKQSQPSKLLKNVLATYLPKRVIEVFIDPNLYEKPLAEIPNTQLSVVSERFHEWTFIPTGTEGYRTAEVTLGGVDCNALSSQTMMASNVPGLYFIGEVVDVTGWLGGYNFQWAWASGWAAGQVV